MKQLQSTKIDNICNSIFSLEIRKGHLKWTVAELARICKISKSLIYYYFGKNKKDIFNSCFEKICRETYGLTAESEALVRQGRLVESMLNIHELYVNTPEFSSFYFKYRTTETDIGRRLLQYDLLYIEKVSKLFPALKQHEVKAVVGMLHGLVISPLASRESYEAAISWLKPMMKKNFNTRL